jgi:hypothetical protein
MEPKTDEQGVASDRPDSVSTVLEPAASDRRRLVRGILTISPVVATLASRPVQALQGFSNLMSGNSSSCHNDGFHGGYSPGAWRQTNGTDDGKEWANVYGQRGVIKPGKQGNKPEHYEGGETWQYGQPAGWYGVPIIDMLYDNGIAKRLAQGYLNANYLTNYFISASTFTALMNGTYSGPLPVGFDLYMLADLIARFENVGSEVDTNCNAW